MQCNLNQAWDAYKEMAAKFGTGCGDIEGRVMACCKTAMVTEITGKLIIAFSDRGITKVQLRKYVQGKYKELKENGLSEKDLDKRILGKCSSALLLK